MINQRVEKHERVFITTMTKKMAEDLTDYLKEMGMKVRYLHSDIKTLERTQIIRDLRLGVFDVLIGIGRGSRCWWTTASACPVPGITGR